MYLDKYFYYCYYNTFNCYLQWCILINMSEAARLIDKFFQTVDFQTSGEMWRHIMKSDTDDQRVRITKMLIREAFLKLLSVKPVSRISVSELCTAAQINRGTFYVHYLDIYDLMEQIEIDLLEAVEQSLMEILKDESKLRDATSMCTAIFSVLENNVELATILLGSYGNSETVDRFTELGKKFYMAAYKKYYPKVNSDQLEALYTFISAGCISLLRRWLLGDKSVSIEHVAEEAGRIISGATLCVIGTN